MNDDKKDYSSIWLSATSHASTVAEAVRLNDYGDVIYKLGNVFAWVLSFAERFRLDLLALKPGRQVLEKHGANWTEWILHKYPGVCSVCGRSPCICSAMRDIMEMRDSEKKAEYEKFKGDRDILIKDAFQRVVVTDKIHESMTMPGLFDNFRNIFGGSIWGASLADVCFHFLEEIGEVSKEINLLEAITGKYYRHQWVSDANENDSPEWSDEYYEVCIGITRELADVFSWTTALCSKVGQLARPTSWKPREAFVKLFTGEIPEGRARRSVMISTDKHRFVCRYCLDNPCSLKCIQELVRGRIRKGMEEDRKKFGYESEDMGKVPSPTPNGEAS